MAPDNPPSNPLQPNADAPRGPGTQETDPAEKPGNPGDLARDPTPLARAPMLSPEEQKRREQTKRSVDEGRKPPEGAGESTSDEPPAAEKEHPAQTLKNWRAP